LKVGENEKGYFREGLPVHGQRGDTSVFDLEARLTLKEVVERGFEEIRYSFWEPLQKVIEEAALDPSEGVDYGGKPQGWGLQMREKFTAEDYHKPSDKVKPYWDLHGAVEELQLLGEVGYRVANAKTYPT
jgi:hypothetical protein